MTGHLSAAKAQETIDLKTLLYQASGSRIGLLLRTPDPARLRNRLNAIRMELNDEDLDKLQIEASPIPEGQLVIVKILRAPKILADDAKAKQRAAQELLRELGL